MEKRPENRFGIRHRTRSIRDEFPIGMDWISKKGGAENLRIFGNLRNVNGLPSAVFYIETDEVVAILFEYRHGGILMKRHSMRSGVCVRMKKFRGIFR